MNVTVIGTGYVGLVSGTCFAELGHQVTCVDVDENKIKTLKAGKSPIYEPGLNELLKRNIDSKNIHFSTGYESVANAKAIFLAVGTPSAENGEADLKYLKMAAISTAKNISNKAVIVIKSTVPVGTNDIIRNLVKEHTDKEFYIANNPEFLKEGSAIDDFMRPDRVVIGSDNTYAGQVLDELYETLVRQGNPLYHMSNQSAELTKYAANCFLATKISFINEIANLCEVTGADIDEVRKGMMSDRRIGKSFFYPGIGYGGSCFPKDVKALIHTAKSFDKKIPVTESAEEVNCFQKTRLFDLLVEMVGIEKIKGMTVGLWGVSFKPNTDDIREAPALYITKKLLEAGAKVKYFDPVASENFKNEFENNNDQIIQCEDKYQVCDGADVLMLLTEWGAFRSPDYAHMKEKMSGDIILDGRNIFNLKEIKENNFRYKGIGRRV